MEENEKNKMIKCPHCQKDVTHIEGADYICPYCGKSLNDQPEKKSRIIPSFPAIVKQRFIKSTGLGLLKMFTPLINTSNSPLAVVF